MDMHLHLSGVVCLLFWSSVASSNHSVAFVVGSYVEQTLDLTSCASSLITCRINIDLNLLCEPKNGDKTCSTA